MQKGTKASIFVRNDVPCHVTKCRQTIHVMGLLQHVTPLHKERQSSHRKNVSQNGTSAPSTEPYGQKHIIKRLQMIHKHFPTALGIDDFLSRVESLLCAHGFTSDNSIAITNLCRDEATVVLKDKIEAIYGASFNTNGLGAVLTCGVTGISAGLSHSPQCADGRERYVFFSFPHIGVDTCGEAGTLRHPGRAGNSTACGALAQCLCDLKTDGIAKSCKVPGMHDPMDPEYTILRQRLARRIRHEGADMQSMDLVKLTGVAERTITDDLEYLIARVVDTSKADYALVTGTEVHNWGGDTAPHLEFIVPARMVVCIKGVKTSVNITAIPPLALRQIRVFAERSLTGKKWHQSSKMSPPGVELLHGTPFVTIPNGYLESRLGADFTQPVATPAAFNGFLPRWKASLESAQSWLRDPSAPSMESIAAEQMVVRTIFTETGIVVYVGEGLEPLEAIPQNGNGVHRLK